MVDDDLVALQYARQDLAAQREAVGDVQMAVEMLLDVGDNLACLVVDGRVAGFLAQQETVDADGRDVVFAPEQSDQGQEDLVGHAQAVDEQQARASGLSVGMESHQRMKAARPCCRPACASSACPRRRA